MGTQLDDACTAQVGARVGMQVPECNEVGKHVWRRARATVPALGLHRPLPGPVRAKRDSRSRSPLYSSEGCVCSAVLTRVHVQHPLPAHESTTRYVTFSGARFTVY